jgi:hypothetical protein
MSWEQLNNSLVFSAFFADATGTGVTGLTVTWDVYNPANTKVVTDGAATEVGGGFYKYTLASGSVTTEGEYVALAKTAATTVAQKQIPALWIVGRGGVEDLDAAISSRSTYSGGAVASVTAGVTVTTNNDKTGYGLSAAAVQAIWDALTSALTTVGSIGKRLVDNLDAAISSRNATAPDNTSIATILSRTDVATSTRNAVAPDNASVATILSRVDAAISSRLAATDYTAPNNANIAAILARTDVATSTRNAVAPDNAGISSIKAKTDNLPADPASNTQVQTRLAANAYIAPPESDTIASEVWSATGRTLTNPLTTAQVYQEVLNALDDAGYTGNRAALLDALANLDTAVSTVADLVWERETRLLSEPFPYVPAAAVVAGAVWDHSPRTLTTAAAMIVQSALTAGGTLTLLRGTDYTGSSVEWTLTGIPSLADATVVFVYRLTTQPHEHTTGTVTVVEAGGEPQRVRLTLTAEQTDAMGGAGPGQYALAVTWPDATHTRPLAGALLLRQVP